MNRDTLKKLFPNASESFLALHLDGQTSSPFVERSFRDGPLAAPEAEAGHSGRFLVCVTSYRRRLLDQDNLCEKYHVDCSRYAGLLPADSPDRAEIKVSQIKVKTKDEEKTLIEITPI
jgi:hypothetical protein